MLDIVFIHVLLKVTVRKAIIQFKIQKLMSYIMQLWFHELVHIVLLKVAYFNFCLPKSLINVLYSGICLRSSHSRSRKNINDTFNYIISSKQLLLQKEIPRNYTNFIR